MKKTSNKSNLDNDDMGNTIKKLNRAHLYKKIQEISPCSIYKLAKEVNENYKTVWYAIRDMEFAGVIETKLEIISGRETRVIYIPKYNIKKQRVSEEK